MIHMQWYLVSIVVLIATWPYMDMTPEKSVENLCGFYMSL